MRSLAVLVLTACLVPLLAVPASAERPVRSSGTYEGMYASSSDCTETQGRTTCTETWVDVWVEPGDELAWVCVYQDRYTVQGDRFRYIGGDGGCSEVDGSVFTSSETGSGTLAPTFVEYGTWRCRKDDCTFTPTGGVTVSAQLTSDGSTSRDSGRGTYTEEGCTYRYSYTSTGGSGTGTITIDGTSSEAWGFVEQSTYKTTETCR